MDRARVGECQLWLTHGIVSALLSSGFFCQNCSLKVNLLFQHVPLKQTQDCTSHSIYLLLFFQVLSAVGWKQIVGGTLTHLGAGK